MVSTSLKIDLFLAQGIIEDPMTKIEWHSCQNLTSEELVVIANTAKKVKNSVERYIAKKLVIKNSSGQIMMFYLLYKSKHSKCLF